MDVVVVVVSILNLFIVTVTIIIIIIIFSCCLFVCPFVCLLPSLTLALCFVLSTLSTSSFFSLSIWRPKNNQSKALFIIHSFIHSIDFSLLMFTYKKLLNHLKIADFARFKFDQNNNNNNDNKSKSKSKRTKIEQQRREKQIRFVGEILALAHRALKWRRLYSFFECTTSN